MWWSKCSVGWSFINENKKKQLAYTLVAFSFSHRLFWDSGNPLPYLKISKMIEWSATFSCDLTLDWDTNFRGTWVAQSVESLTLDSGSGLDPKFVGSSPMSVPHSSWRIICLGFSLSHPLPLPCSHTLSQLKNKNIFFKKDTNFNFLSPFSTSFSFFPHSASFGIAHPK